MKGKQTKQKEKIKCVRNKIKESPSVERNMQRKADVKDTQVLSKQTESS